MNTSSARLFIEKEFPLVPLEGLTDVTAYCNIKEDEEKIIHKKLIKE